MIVVSEVAGGRVIDRVSLVDGSLDYATGAARPLFDGRRRFASDDAGLYALMSDWSNGYVRTREQP